MKLFDNRTEFYQYDTNQKLICDECKVGEEIHFSNTYYAKAAICLTYEHEGLVVVDVPNDYLLRSGELTVYRMYINDDGRSTVDKYTFNVLARKKPSDYVYEETEVMSYKALADRIQALEENGGSGEVSKEQITEAVEEYFEENPIEAKDGITPHIGDNGNWFVGERDTGVNANGKNGVTPHIGTNGNWFVGDVDTGVQAQGKNGDDYVLTDADKSEIARIAVDLLPKYNGEVEDV